MVCEECGERVAEEESVVRKLEREENRQRRPSLEREAHWLWADRQVGKYPATTRRRGKWLVFRHRSQIDEWWDRIRDAVEAGRLGSSAKVSTARPSPFARNPNEHVICVYTYDGEVREDVFRVREELRRLGVTWPISYKPDSTTLAGRYHGTGVRVSTYRA
jgi:hypothetical protein